MPHFPSGTQQGHTALPAARGGKKNIPMPTIQITVLKMLPAIVFAFGCLITLALVRHQHPNENP